MKSATYHRPRIDARHLHVAFVTSPPNCQRACGGPRRIAALATGQGAGRHHRGQELRTAPHPGDETAEIPRTRIRTPAAEGLRSIGLVDRRKLRRAAERISGQPECLVGKAGLDRTLVRFAGGADVASDSRRWVR